MTEEQVLERITAVALVVGGALALLGVVLAPGADELDTSLKLAAAYAAGEGSARLGIIGGAVGVWAFVLGFANVHHFIGAGSGAAWGRLGFYTLIIGAAGWTVAAGLSLASVEASVAWSSAAAGGSGGDFDSVEALILAAVQTGHLAGFGFAVALVFIGVAWTRTNRYPKWSSVVLLALAVVLLVLAAIGLIADFNGTVYSTALIVSGAVGVWAVASGLWLARKAW